MFRCICGLGEIALLPALRPLFAVGDEVWSIACALIVAHNLMAIAFHPAAFNLAGALRAAGDVQFTMVVGIASLAVCRLGCAWGAGVVAGWGIYGVWLGMGADWLARSIAFGLRWRSRAWEGRAVTEGDAEAEPEQAPRGIINRTSDSPPTSKVSKFA